MVIVEWQQHRDNSEIKPLGKYRLVLGKKVETYRQDNAGDWRWVQVTSDEMSAVLRSEYQIQLAAIAYLLRPADTHTVTCNVAGGVPRSYRDDVVITSTDVKYTIDLGVLR